MEGTITAIEKAAKNLQESSRDDQGIHFGVSVMNLTGKYVQRFVDVLTGIRVYEINISIGGRLSRQNKYDIIHGLFSNPNIKGIIFGRAMHIDTDFIDAINDSLRLNRTLIKLYMHNAQISPKKLSTLGVTLSFNPALQHLNLSYCSLPSSGMRDFVDNLRLNHTLQSLDLSYCQLGRYDEDWLLSIAHFIDANKPLRKLVLKGNYTMRAGGSLTTFSAALAKNTHLQELDMRVCGMSDERVAALASRTNNCIKTLNLSDNTLTGASLNLLVQNFTALTTLDIGSNYLTDEAMAQFLNMLRTNTSILSLNMSNQEGEDVELSEETVALFGHVLAQNVTLTTLDISQLNIGTNGARGLATALRTNTTLKSLDLTMCNIGLDGARALGEMLAVNETLADLHLVNNDIGNVGAIALAGGLRGRSILRLLDVSENNIGTPGLIALAGALALSVYIEVFWFRDNVVDAAGATALAAMIREHSFLQNLSLANCGIDTAAIQTLIPALENNSTLTELHLEENEIGYVGELALMRMLETNMTLQVLKADDLPHEIEIQIQVMLNRNTRMSYDRSGDTKPASQPPF